MDLPSSGRVNLLKQEKEKRYVAHIDNFLNVMQVMDYSGDKNNARTVEKLKQSSLLELKLAIE